MNRRVVITGLTLTLVIVGIFVYERASVIKCTAKAAQAVIEFEGADVLDRGRAYDLFYTVCMGRKGFER
jgi:hypothetical protein